MIQFLSAVPWWDCLWWRPQLRQPGWYHYLQHLNREISIPGAARGVQGRIWRGGFTVLPTAHRSMSCKVLSGLCEPLAVPISLLCLSRRNLLPWVYSGPMTTGGETSHTHGTEEAPPKQWKVCVRVGTGFWRLGSSSPCWLAHLFSQGWTTSLWSALSVFCTIRCLVQRWRLWKAKFLHACRAVPAQAWANLSQSWLYFSDTHNRSCSCQI